MRFIEKARSWVTYLMCVAKLTPELDVVTNVVKTVSIL